MVSETDRFVVLSGCSGGGKSTLLRALSDRGYPVVEEPGRRIIASGGPAPWIDMAGFAERAVAMSLDDRARIGPGSGWVFFDRGLVDALVARRQATGEGVAPMIAAHRYHRTVFLTPPWPELFAEDAERRHGFNDAVYEYDRLVEAYVEGGYQVVVLPKVGVEARASFVLDQLGASGA